jgi:Uma2 family endonuclease
MASATLLESQQRPARPAAEEPLYEVINGQRVELPPMGIYATLIASKLQSRMGPFAEGNKLGTVVTEALFILDPERDLRRRPDVAFVSAQRWPLDRPIPEAGDWAVVPDLAVEVISPNDLHQDVMARMREYFQKGVLQVWIVVPSEDQVQVFDTPNRSRLLSVGDVLDGGTLLPDFRLPVADLFKRQAAAPA